MKTYPLDIKVAEETHKRELPIIFDMARKALSRLLPKQTIEIKGGSIVACHGHLTLDPVIFESKRIGGTQEHAGWQVVCWTYVPASYDSPEDAMDSTVGEPGHYLRVVGKFIEAIFKFTADAYWEEKALEEDERFVKWGDVTE